MTNQNEPQQVTLDDHLALVRERESGGSTANNRLEIQHIWGVCQLLELYDSGNDFALVCEFLEDFALLDRPIGATRISLIQVKSRGSHWTPSALAEPLGKLCASAAQLPDQRSINRLIFVSNQTCSDQFTLPNGEFARTVLNFGLEDLDPHCRADLEQRITAKLSEPVAVSGLPLRIEHFAVSIHDVEAKAIAEVERFFRRRDPTRRYPAIPLVITIGHELRLKAGIETSRLSWEETRQKKGISRAQFEDMLHQAHPNSLVDDVRQLLHRELTGKPMGQRGRIMDEFRMVVAEHTDATALNLHSLLQKVETQVRELGDLALLEASCALHTRFNEQGLTYSLERVTVLVAWNETRRAFNSPVPTPSPQPSERAW